MTVGELIEELSKHENDAQLEIVLEGVSTVGDLITMSIVADGFLVEEFELGGVED
ncbi:hypothetical protein [Listeria sp. SHR_NRA_18]|uniref:hypothetical protein n=1 Tax=Listeria sp. SHR_NRA_18 TaxID=2269046 RepID=UPI001374DC20|nr:hypothetical protein [Listeria sp. SHR_NRA_18]